MKKKYFIITLFLSLFFVFSCRQENIYEQNTKDNKSNVYVLSKKSLPENVLKHIRTNENKNSSTNLKSKNVSSVNINPVYEFELDNSFILKLINGNHIKYIFTLPSLDSSIRNLIIKEQNGEIIDSKVVIYTSFQKENKKIDLKNFSGSRKVYDIKGKQISVTTMTNGEAPCEGANNPDDGMYTDPAWKPNYVEGFDPNNPGDSGGSNSTPQCPWSFIYDDDEAVGRYNTCTGQVIYFTYRNNASKNSNAMSTNSTNDCSDYNIILSDPEYQSQIIDMRRVFLNKLDSSGKTWFNSWNNIGIGTYLATEYNRNPSTENLNFLKWSVKFFRENSSVSWTQFSKWFMGKSEGQDGEYNSAYWDNPNLTFPQQNLPSWTVFEANYPKHKDITYDTPEKMYSEVGGMPYSIFISSGNENTCALRISWALNRSNIIIPNIPNQTFKGKDNKYYFLSAKALFAWMKKTFGTPISPYHITGTQGGLNGEDFPDLINNLPNKNGIYIMIPNVPGGCPTPTAPSTGFCASGHADMISNGVIDGGGYFNAKGGVKEIYIWPLQP